MMRHLLSLLCVHYDWRRLYRSCSEPKIVVYVYVCNVLSKCRPGCHCDCLWHVDALSPRPFG